jgi:hypothetical protein
VGTALGLASFLVPRGALAAALAGVWLVTTLVIASCGGARLLRRGVAPLEEVAIDLSHLYLPVGAVWLLASRAGHSLLGFHEPVVLYTAAHFHFAGFSAPLVVGMLGRELRLTRSPRTPDEPLATAATRRLYAASTVIVLAGIPLVAAGIQLSRSLEMPAAILLGSGMLGAASLLVVAGSRRLAAPPLRTISGVLLIVAGLSLVFSMGLAVAFTTTGSATRGSAAPLIPYSMMAMLHGVANAGGFASLGVVAFSLSPASPRHGPLRGTWPRLFGKGFIGPRFFDRTDAVAPGREVLGQLGSLDDFVHRTFVPAAVHPAVRDFYEHTASYELHLVPTWHFPFRTGGIIFAWIARRWLGQLELPTRAEGDELVTTRLFAIRDEIDGRSDVRGYVRTYGEGTAARANYVAAYSTHVAPDGRFLSAAFPLPHAVLVGVLRFDDGPTPGSLALSSGPRPSEAGSDEGMFLVTPLGVLRLPVEEKISVWPSNEGPPVRARHEVWVCGLRCFTLDYSIAPRIGLQDEP